MQTCTLQDLGVFIPPMAQVNEWMQMAQMAQGLSEWMQNCTLQDLGVFIPPMAQGMRTDFFMENAFLQQRFKLDRETLGGLADMFGQMPGKMIRGGN